MIELIAALYAIATIVCWVVLVRVEYDSSEYHRWCAGEHLVMACFWWLFAIGWAAMRVNDALELVARRIRRHPAPAPPQPASGAEGPSDDSGDPGRAKRARGAARWQE